MSRASLTLLFLALAAPVRAAELWASGDGELALEGSGSLKAQALGMDYDGLGLLAPPDTERAIQSASRLRLESAFFWADLRLDAAVDLSARAVTGDPDAGDVSLFSVGSTAPRPRLWDLDPSSQDGASLAADLDRAAVSFPLGRVDLTLGRQAISWGSAWFWKPTDRFSPFSPMDVDPDVKRGVDAARAEVYLGQTTSLDLITSFEHHDEGDRALWVHGGARFRTTLGRYDLALSLARFQFQDDADWMIGAEYTGEIWDLGFRGEVALNIQEEARSTDLEAVVGLDYTLTWLGQRKLTLAAEGFYNGYGVADANDYLPFLMDPKKSARLWRGEAFHVGRYYAGLSASQELNPLWTLTLSSIANLGDPSALFTAGLRWSIVQNARVTAGLMLPVGERPEGLAMRSEMGSFPVIGYGVIKLSF